MFEWRKELTLEEMIQKREKTGMPPRYNMFRRAGRPKLPFSDKDWYIIECALEDGMTIADVAKIMCVSNKRLRRRIQERCPGMVENLHGQNLWYHLGRIRRGKRNWTASAWYLERVVRKRFALGGQTEADEDKRIKMRRIVRKTVTEEETSEA